jgi:hypothetical protein
MEKHAQSYTGIVLHHAQVRHMIEEAIYQSVEDSLPLDLVVQMAQVEQLKRIADAMEKVAHKGIEIDVL